MNFNGKTGPMMATPPARPADCYRLILRLILRYRWQLAEVVIYVVLGVLCYQAIPISSKYLLDRLVAVGESANVKSAALQIIRTVLVPVAVGLFALQVVGGLVAARRLYLIQLISHRVAAQLRQVLLAHLIRLPHEFYQREPVPHLVTNVTEDVTEIGSAVTQIVGAGFYQSVMALSAIAFLARLSLLLTACIIPVLLVSALLFQRTQSQVKRRSSEYHTDLEQYAAAIQQVLSAQALIKA